MSAAKNKRAVTVGIFVFLGLAIFAIGILTLGGQHKTFVSKIDVKALFDDVSGLQTGNNVWFSGVKIGTVKKVGFSGDAKVQIIMSIEDQARQYIRKNAKAKISSDGLIGNKIIVIYGGTTKYGLIQSGDVLRVENTLNTDNMMDTLQENNRNLLDITKDFKKVSSKIAAGQGTVGKLISDDALADNLHATLFVLNRAALNAEKLSANLSSYTARLRNKGSLSNELVTDTVIFSSLRTTVAQLKEVANSASGITNNFREVSNNVKMATNNLSDSSTPVGLLLHDQATAADLKTTIKNLQSGTEKLDENMEALQHNFLLRGFFRKKAKKEAEEKIKIKETVQSDSSLHK